VSLAEPQAQLGELRRFFPIFASRDRPLHYLDSAATGQICAAAAEALLAYETRARANVKRGVYRLADAATNAFAGAREQVAGYLGAAEPNEVIFTSGTTAGLNLAAHTLASRLSPGDEILLSELEHHSNIVPWQLAARPRGVRFRAIPADDEGRLDLGRLDEVLSRHTRIISVTHASNVTGAVSDLASLREAARSVGALLVVDGAQRVPHGPVDVQEIGCDVYACSAHKMFGATGAGALWVRGDLARELPPFLGGGEMIRRVSIEETSYALPPHRFEAGTPPIGSVIAMGAAADWLGRLDWPAITRKELGLTERLLDGLQSLSPVRIIGPQGLRSRIGVVAFEVAGVHAHDVCQMLDGFGVCLRGGHHCAQPLMDRFDLDASARASLALYNNEADVDAMLNGLEQTIERLR
jgi:cysteine desulfurase / selenocysteine lyase